MGDGECPCLTAPSDAADTAAIADAQAAVVFKRVSKENSMGLLSPKDNTTKPDGSLGLGRITMELLFDPPDHVRLPDNDDEIVDRAVAVQTLAGRPVTMVTYDKGMSLRARYAGLQEI